MEPNVPDHHKTLPPAGYTEGIPTESGRYTIIVRAVGGWWLADSPSTVTFTVTPYSAVYVHDAEQYPGTNLAVRTSGNWRDTPTGVAWRTP